MAGLKIGDVVEIKTRNGLAYAQYTHKHKQYGALLRVFSVISDSRPVNFEFLVMDEPRFMCFFPLSAAVKQGIVSVVANVAIPLEAKRFPVFRSGIVDPSTGKVANWWLWDGENEWMVGSLTAEQRRLSILGVWNDTFLIERIESGWSPEYDPR